MSDVTAAMDLRVEEPRLVLPPGFRFHPTDKELVSEYLTPKVLDRSFSCRAVADVDLNEHEPWDLPGQAKMGEKEWYFFVHKSRRYPTGKRTKRATESGYWKATGRDKEIFHGDVLVGMKKTLVFHLGRAPRGEKTPWVMHEYRLDGELPAHLPPSAKDEWAVCRVIGKHLVAKNAPQMAPAAGGVEPSDSMFFIDDLIDLDGLPPLMDSTDGTADDELIDLDGLPPLVDWPFDGVADDDFTGASSSTSGAAVPPEPDVGYMAKTEQPAPPQDMQSAYYFSMPAATNSGRGGAGYSHYQDAIRREAPSSSKLPGPLLGGEAEMPSGLDCELDYLYSEPPTDYYSTQWKF